MNSRLKAGIRLAFLIPLVPLGLAANVVGFFTAAIFYSAVQGWEFWLDL